MLSIYKNSKSIVLTDLKYIKHMSEQEFSYKRLLPTCRLIVSIMACVSCISGVAAGYLFMTSLSGVSEAVKIVWTTGSALYALSSLLLIIAVWKVNLKQN